MRNVLRQPPPEPSVQLDWREIKSGDRVVYHKHVIAVHEYLAVSRKPSGIGGVGPWLWQHRGPQTDRWGQYVSRASGRAWTTGAAKIAAETYLRKLP